MPRKRQNRSSPSDAVDVEQVPTRRSRRLKAAAKDESSPEVVVQEEVKVKEVKQNGSHKTTMKGGDDEDVEILKDLQNGDTSDSIESDVSLYKPGPSNGKATKNGRLAELESSESVSSDECSDWESVADKDEEELEGDDHADSYRPEIPAEGISFEMDAPNVNAKKKRNKRSVEDLIRQEANRAKKELQVLIHQSHLLILIGRGFYLNRITLTDQTRALAMSHLTPGLLDSVPKKLNLKWLTDTVDYFHSIFSCASVTAPPDERPDAEQELIHCLESRSAPSWLSFSLAFISLLRVLLSDKPTSVRLICALNPVPLKPKNLALSDLQLERRKSNKKNGPQSPSKTSPTKAKKLTEQSSDKPKRRKKTAKVLSSSDSDQKIQIVGGNVGSNPKDGLSSQLTADTIDVWCEVYVDSESRWIPVEINNRIFDDAPEIERLVGFKLLYVLSFNGKPHLKDLTSKYSSAYLTAAMRNQHVDQDWWKKSLRKWKAKHQTKADKMEDKLIDLKLESTPIPTKLGDFQNHPLYALRRHILKYQALYPPDAVPVGYFKNTEPVYRRDAIATLRSRETWLRFAKQVKPGEEPYKTSTSRPKYDKFTGQMLRDLPLELYGEWQTEDYVPPDAVDGKVPRNAYGNVELFQPCMLPGGCVHLQDRPGLLRIANKLGIDCVPAVIGFDGNHGNAGSHPVFDGFVVCQEFASLLDEAWHEEQTYAAKRDEERRMKRILDNWKKLFRGVMRMERLKTKYGQPDDGQTQDDVDMDSESD